LHFLAIDDIYFSCPGITVRVAGIYPLRVLSNAVITVYDYNFRLPYLLI